MTNIIESSRDYTKQDIFRMTHNSESLKNIPEGEIITIAGWALLDTTKDPDEDGELFTQRILIIETVDIEDKHNYIATQSDVVYRELMDIWEAFVVDAVGNGDTVEVCHVLGTSKSGRTFHNIRVV